MKYEKIGAALFAFKRPDYLRQVLTALEENEEAYNIEWHGFVDGPINLISGNRYATDKEVAAVAALMENSKLPFVDVYRNEDNRCIARQKYAAFKLYKYYDLMYFFEDDLVVSPYYCRLLRIAAQRFPNYMILMNTHRNISGELNMLERCGIARIWGSAMSRPLYLRIANAYEEWHKGISQIDYILRSSLNLRQYGIKVNSHDVALTQMVRRFGAGKLWPVKTRARYIGRKGNIAYRTDRTWFKKGMDKQPEKFHYPSDAKLRRFRLRR